jgi:hypothetical protein
MNITIEKFFELRKSSPELLDAINSSAAFIAAHDFLVQVTQSGKDFTPYYKSDKIKETVDLFLKKLEAAMPQKSVKTKSIKSQTKNKKQEHNNQKETKPSKKTVPKPKVIKESIATFVEHIPSDIALVRKYIGLHNKRKTYEQVLSIWRSVEKAVVERKVIKESAHKTTIEHIQKNLKKALEASEATGTLELSIEPKALEQYKAIAESVEKSASVPLLLELINISGKAKQQERAAKLSKRMSKALDKGLLENDRYKKQVENALIDLEHYIEGDNTHVLLQNFSLNGFADISVNGCECKKGLSGNNRTQNAVILKLIQEKVKNLDASELNRAFKETVAPNICKLIARKLIQTGQLSMSLIRNPAAAPIALSGMSNVGFNWGSEIMDMRVRQAAQKQMSSNFERQGIFGLGNTELNNPLASDAKILSAQTLAQMKFQTIGLTGKYRALIGDPEPGFSAMIYGKPFAGKSTLAIDFAKELTQLGKVLYCAYEEGHGGTLQDKINRNNAAVPGLDFADKLPNDLSAYRFVFIDSVTDARLNEQDFNTLIKANKPNTSIIGIFHATKDGKFRGGQTFAHDADIVMRVEDGVVYAQGRYSPPSEMKLGAYPKFIS